MWGPRTHKCSKPDHLALTTIPPGDGRDLRLHYHPRGWDHYATPSPPNVCPAGPAPVGSDQDGLPLNREGFCLGIFGLDSKVQRNNGEGICPKPHSKLGRVSPGSLRGPSMALHPKCQWRPWSSHSCFLIESLRKETALDSCTPSFLSLFSVLPGTPAHHSSSASFGCR